MFFSYSNAELVKKEQNETKKTPNQKPDAKINIKI